MYVTVPLSVPPEPVLAPTSAPHRPTSDAALGPESTGRLHTDGARHPPEEPDHHPVSLAAHRETHQTVTCCVPVVTHEMVMYRPVVTHEMVMYLPVVTHGNGDVPPSGDARNGDVPLLSCDARPNSDVASDGDALSSREVPSYYAGASWVLKPLQMVK